MTAVSVHHKSSGMPQEQLNFDVISRVVCCLQNEKEGTAPNANMLPSAPYRASCNALLSLAMTCHTLKELSLKALWRRQDHLLPVIKLIPQLTLALPIGWSRRGYWVIDGFVSSNDWDLFDRYARMIQEIHFNPQAYEVSRSGTIHDSVYIYLSSSRGGILFPNLSKVVTVVGLVTHLFCSTNLRQVSLIDPRQPDGEDPWASNFINRACAISSNLQQVVLDSVFVHTSALRAIFIIPGLRELHFRLASSMLRTQFQTAIDNVPALPKLEHLVILCCSDPSGAETPMPSIPHTRLQRLQTPNLRTVHFRGSLESVALLSESIQGHNLHSFEASLFQGPVERSQVVYYERIWQQLCHLSSNNLEEIFFETGYNAPNFDPAMGVHLSPLYQLHNLRVLSFRTFAPFVMTDHDMEVMSQSWPHLQVLTIPLPTSFCPPRLTLRGVTMMAELCPYLETLDLTFDATDLSTIPIISPERKQSLRAQRLFSLNVNDSPLTQECAKQVTALLKCLFPNLERLVHSTGYFYLDGLVSLWWDVQDRVEDLTDGYAQD